MRTASSRDGLAPMTRSTRARRTAEPSVWPWLGVGVEHAARDGAPAELGHELGGAGQHVGGRLDVAAALEAVGRVGVERQRARGATDGAGIPVGRLEEHARRGRGHLALGAAHHAADAHRVLGIAHHRHVRAEGALLAVEGLDPLARLRATHHHRVPGEGVEVEGVERLAQLPHDVVGHVDQVVDRAQADRAQPLGEPGRRRLHREPRDHPGAEARAEVGGLHVHRGEGGGVGLALGGEHAGEAEGRAGEGRDLARDPDHRERVRPVGRDLDVEDPVVEAQVGREVGAQRGLGGQYEDAAVVVAQAELLLRAQDALRDHAANPRRLHLPHPGQARARGREGRAQAGGRVGGAAHHLEVAPRQGDAHEPVVVAGRAHPEVALDGLDLAHHHAREAVDHRRDLLHPDARVGEPVGHRAGVEIRLDELLEPAVRDLHRPGRPPNCWRKRRSLSKKRRMSSISYLSSATRSIPIPKAQPVTSSGS